METAAQATAQSAFGALAPGMGMTMNGIAGVLLMASIIQGAVLNKSPHGYIIGQMVSLAVCGTLLSNYGVYNYYVVQTMQEYMSFISLSVMGGSGGIGLTPSMSLLGRAETVNLGAINIATAIMGEAGLSSLDLIPAGLILMIPFIINMVVYIGLIVFSIFLIYIPVAVGPVIICAGAFKGTRKLMFAGLDFFISAIAITTIATFFVSVSTTAITSYTASLTTGFNPWNATSAVPTFESGAAGGFVWQNGYWVMVLLGASTTFFLGITPSLAGYFTGRVDSANMAAAVGRTMSNAVQSGSGALRTMADVKSLFGRR